MRQPLNPTSAEPQWIGAEFSCPRLPWAGHMS